MYRMLVFSCFLLGFTPANADNLDVEVEEHCILRCPSQFQNRTDASNYNLGCGYDCSISQCSQGCKQWKRALVTSCQSVCNATQDPLSATELYCIMGCNDAITWYFTQLRTKLGTPPAPALVADSLTSTSLKLEWNFPEAKQAGLTYLVQWRYEELAGSWQYYRNQTWGPYNTVTVENLQPYTKYRFRVALLLSQQSEPIVSAPSVVISTLSAGVPASTPVIVRAVPVDCTRISVSWEPGPFPHGPILSYLLRISENAPQGYSALKDIPAEENKFYMFKNLKPATNYTVSISMRNGVGSGPVAQAFVATPPKPVVKHDQKPILILSGHHTIIQQGVDLIDEPKVLYQTKEYIKGTAIHVSKQLLFVSDSKGKVLRMSLYNKSEIVTILTQNQIHFKPLDLSIDWLNDQIYILGEMLHQRSWQITRCDLNGKGLQVAIGGLRIKPHHIEIDPYNGYLFWVTYGAIKGGLYRLDLSDISNGIRRETPPEHILQRPDLGAFTVDHTNFRVLVANQTESTIISVSLDGKETVNIRPKITKSRMQKVISLATANKLFYWTDGEDVFYEEYHSPLATYFHNSYPGLTDRKYFSVLINLPSCQPIPVPLNPPTAVQAVFGKDIAKASWLAPHLLGGQGKGAWQNWTYKVSIRNMVTYQTLTFGNINTTSFIIRNLTPDTEYEVRASAYTTYGPGPWSKEFKAKTLKLPKDDRYPSIFWSASEGVFMSDPTGENVENLIPQSHFKNNHFTDIDWYEDQLYMVTNNSRIFWYNLTSHRGGHLTDIESVSSVAVDWIGKKLYWSNPKQQVIKRGNLNGTHQEPLLILTMAKELSIDAIRAYLYWSTGHAVECAHLNGADRIVYHPAQLFSGKQVMGITLDFDHNHIYWIVRGSEGSNLFRAPMAGTVKNASSSIPRKISSLEKPYMQGPLCYFNNRLLWLQDDKNAIISDLDGNNMAGLGGKSLYGLTTLTVMDSELHQWPNVTLMSGETLNVIPEQVEQNSIKVVGSWNSFNITWKPIERVNYGIVFYEIRVDSLSSSNLPIVTNHSSIKYWQTVMPYTKLHVTLRAYTYWGTSPITTTKIYSPPSTPSSPRNLRVYVSYDVHHFDRQEVNATFRWDAPLYSNGVIKGYTIKCCEKDEDGLNEECQNAFGDPQQREYIFHNLSKDKIYYFQVQAFTEVGDGEPSAITSVNTSKESPLPMLLVSSDDSIFIQDIDINQNYSLLHGISTPVEMAYLIKENKLFWINEMQELFMFNLVSYNRSKLVDLNGNCISLTVDWLERSLYYLEQDASGESVVYKLNLNGVDRGTIKVEEILRSSANILKIEVSPFTRKLYWVEESENGENHIIQGNIDGSEIRPFFAKRSQNKRALEEDLDTCNCPVHPNVERTFTVDHSDSRIKPAIIFIDSDSDSIMSSDKNGCYCTVLANHNLVGNSFPLQKLKSDFGTLYWTNKTQGHLYSLKKSEANVTKKQQINARDILIYGSHMQPYPLSKCLIPKFDENLSVTLVNKTSHALTLAMPNVPEDKDCQNTSLATIEYTVYYMPFLSEDIMECDESCSHVTTLEKVIEIVGLKPFTKYVFQVSINNYFMDLMKHKPHIGPPVVLQTSAGAPSKPQSVSATVLNPNMAQISWSAPEELNGESIWYEIHWQTESTLNGIRQKGEQVVINPEISEEDKYLTYLYKLSPNETYSVWIRAHSQTNETYSDSESVIIKTFPEPSDINLVNATATELQILWKTYFYAEKYKIEFAPLALYSSWEDVHSNEVEYRENEIIITIGNLKPKTQYKFRLVLFYPLYPEPYIWPSDVRFTFETLGDKPSPPGTPIIQHVKGDVYQVWWEPSKDNGAPIEVYMLEALRLRYYRNKRSTNFSVWYNESPFIEEDEDEWISVYNGTDNSWIISNLDENFKYSFRVSALNMYGWSLPSEQSEEFDPDAAAKLDQKQNPLSLIIIAICVPSAFCFVVIICFVCCKLRCSRDKKTKQLILSPRGPDVELATLRELPRRGIHSTNILYEPNQPLSEDVTMLPHIRREMITLTKFLGSGAFGEVFEGRARGILANGTEIRVAVKTLRKGASDQEKCEFLQEAQLMSHFKHDHILQLLGVCLDNDPQFIIMELMQGGDLLTYLRSSRNPSSNTPSLTLVELLKMCVDVAKGCKYLEEMHFVHRDLACRNCLVSSTNKESRIVKIGDFGLARDIYKNDYYRKEGEGLLPVRWMAPESLVDGVFTSQSDVWAFGVLLWEIMTLGQQPYPARNNLEVLHYVKSGGRLGKPVHCPETLYDLMLKCWTYEPERRPMFKFCLYVLEDLHAQVSNDPVTGAHEGQYISTIEEMPYGVSNQAYFQEETVNSGSSWKSGSEGDLSREKTPFLQPSCDEEDVANASDKVPKYLELLYDSESQLEDKSHLDNDGYEIPRSSFQTTPQENKITKEIETDNLQRNDIILGNGYKAKESTLSLEAVTGQS